MRVCSSGFGVVIRVRVRCVGSLIIILRGEEGKKGRKKDAKQEGGEESGWIVVVMCIYAGSCVVWW